MTYEEWKKELAAKCDAIPAMYKGMVEHIEKIEKIDGVDQEEAQAVALLKISKMQEVIENLCE